MFFTLSQPNLKGRIVLTFIIPVRHQLNAKNWEELKRNLSATIASISNQSCKNWQCVIVANEGADIPVLPKGFVVKRVDFPPNPFYSKREYAEEVVNDAVRLDKGKRILAGLLHVRSSLRYFMVVDDDDFVSNKLASFVENNNDETGWYFRHGYVWNENGSVLYKHDNFSKLCGTSHIINVSVMELPSSLNAAEDEYIKNMLGSHVFIESYLTMSGQMLCPLPFAGAIYRVGGGESHSRSKNIARLFFAKRKSITNPLQILSSFKNLRYFTKSIKNEFGFFD